MNQPPDANPDMAPFGSRAIRIWAGIMIAMGALLTLAYASDMTTYRGRPDVQTFVKELAAGQGFDEDWLDNVMKSAQYSDKVIALMNAPIRRPRPWPQYRAAHIGGQTVENGLDFFTRHHESLARAEADYGVPAEIIAAILGVETRYGANTGGFSTLSALATLSFDYPRRSNYFRQELIAYLELARAGRLDPVATTGSFAGAIGIPQFMPSSIQKFGVDFDGDGAINLSSDVDDAIGSVANYLALHGWQKGEAIASLAEITQPVDKAETGIDLKHTPDTLARLGVSGAEKLPTTTHIGLVLLPGGGMEADEYWLAFNNFYVITRYNHSSMYAMAVYQLAEAIRDRYDLAAQQVAQPASGSGSLSGR